MIIPDGLPERWHAIYQSVAKHRMLLGEALTDLAAACAALREIRDYQGDVYWTSNDVARAALDALEGQR